MSKQSSTKPVSAALGVAFVTSLAAAPATHAGNPFELTELSHGYMVAEAEGRCGGNKGASEGNCGENRMERKSVAEGECGAKASKEGNCGEDKQREATKKKEGKCGEGKCGSV